MKRYDCFEFRETWLIFQYVENKDKFYWPNSMEVYERAATSSHWGDYGKFVAATELTYEIFNLRKKQKRFY